MRVVWWPEKSSAIGAVWLNVRPEFGEDAVYAIDRQETLDDHAPVAIEYLDDLLDAGTRGQPGQFCGHRLAS